MSKIFIIEDIFVCRFGKRGCRIGKNKMYLVEISVFQVNKENS